MKQLLNQQNITHKYYSIIFNYNHKINNKLILHDKHMRGVTEIHQNVFLIRVL